VVPRACDTQQVLRDYLDQFFRTGRGASACVAGAGTKTLRPAKGSTKITVGKNAPPGEYMINLDCIDAAGANLGYNAAQFTVVKPPPPPPPPRRM
jgi:hypothetical protein